MIQAFETNAFDFETEGVELQTRFSSRKAMTAYLAAQLEGLYSTNPIPNERRGGRKAALEALNSFTVVGYTRRNFVSAATSRLSAYLRHGVISIFEVADHVRQTTAGRERDEFLKQLTWREFFYLVLKQEGEGVLENLEEPKYAVRWREALPDDVRKADTGLPCTDAWISRLIDTGYMHNHERLWFAAYLTHWRKIHWKAGYAFFREHLLDGDIASNGLSWQWVASTFSSKPYFMNQENIQKYSNDAYCSSCTAKCPFKASYAQLELELFGASRGWAS